MKKIYLKVCSKIKKRIRLKKTRKVYGQKYKGFFNFDLVWHSFTDKQSMVSSAGNIIVTLRLLNDN